MYKTSELIKIQLPEFKSIREAMENAIELSKVSKAIYATSTEFKTKVINEPLPHILLEYECDVLHVPRTTYADVWADTFNLAKMDEEVPNTDDMNLMTFMSEFERYQEGLGVWHNCKTFSKFLGHD